MKITTPHHGQNVKDIRELLGIKQEEIAAGLKVSQQQVSLLEKEEIIDDEQLLVIAGIFKVPIEAIKNFNKEKMVNIIATTFTNNNHGSNSAFMQYYPTFNPIDKVVELLEKQLKAANDEVAWLRNELEKEKARNKK